MPAIRRVQARMAMFLSFAPSTATTLEFVYVRRPRQLIFENVGSVSGDGTVTTTAGSRTITGSGTNWTSDMVGCAFRLSPDGSNYPSGLEGNYPAPVDERIVTAYVSTTQLTVSAVITTSRSAAKYQLSDVVDVPPGILNYFKALYVKRAFLERRAADAELAVARCNEEFLNAAAADMPYSSSQDSMLGSSVQEMEVRVISE